MPQLLALTTDILFCCKNFDNIFPIDARYVPNKHKRIELNNPVFIYSFISSENTNVRPIKPIIAPTTVLNWGYSLKIKALLAMFIEIIVEKIIAINPVVNPEPAAL